MCRYCEIDDGHTVETCPERLEDQFGMPGDDDSHASRIAAQLAESDAEDREQSDADEDEDDDGLRADGGQQTLSVGETRPPHVLENVQRTSMGEIVAMVMCAHRFDPEDLRGWHTHDPDAVIRGWVQENAEATVSRLLGDDAQDHSTRSPAWIPEEELERAREHACGDETEQTTLMTDGGVEMDIEDIEQPWRNESIVRELCEEKQLPITEVAARLGCNRDTVYRWLKKHDISQNGAPAKDKPEYTDSDVLKELYWGEEMSMPEIAEKFDCHHSTIQDWMDKHDIESRDPDPANRREKPWRDESTLRQMYVAQELSIFKIADRLNCGHATVDQWLSRHGIEKRDHMEWSRINRSHKPAVFWTNRAGYEGWHHFYDGDSYEVLVHRLQMVSEHGFDELDGKDVHHKNEIPWDNRPENLELLTSAEHAMAHQRPDDAPWRDEETFRDALEQVDSLHELTDYWDCSAWPVYEWADRHGIRGESE